MPLTADRVQSALDRPVRFYEQVASTNDLALAWLRDGASAGAVVLADEQTLGRGRLGRAWLAPPGTALMLSVIVRPPSEAVGSMTMLGAVAICELLESLGAADVGIKWPNDVRLNGRKVCGILPEAAWDGQRLLGVVLGIGLNVRIDFANTPLADSAISLEPALDTRIDRLDLLVTLLSRIDLWTQTLQARHELFAAWKRRLTMLGQRVSVSSVDDSMQQGVAEDVDNTGALLLRTDDGRLHRLVAGDIALGKQDQPDGD